MESIQRQVICVGQRTMNANGSKTRLDGTSIVLSRKVNAMNVTISPTIPNHVIFFNFPFTLVLFIHYVAHLLKATSSVYDSIFDTILSSIFLHSSKSAKKPLFCNVFYNSLSCSGFYVLGFITFTEPLHSQPQSV